MDRLKRLAQDKATMGDLKVFFIENLKEKLISKAFLKQDISGYAEANEIIKHALKDLEDMVNIKKPKGLNRSE